MLSTHQTTLHEMRLVSKGEVYNLSFTRTQEGQAVCLALVKLEDGSFITAQLDGSERPHIGMQVELAQRRNSQVSIVHPHQTKVLSA